MNCVNDGLLCITAAAIMVWRRIWKSLAKILRWYLLYGQDLLSDLSWKGRSKSEAAADQNPFPPAIISIQTFGDSPNISNRNY